MWYKKYRRKWKFRKNVDKWTDLVIIFSLIIFIFIYNILKSYPIISGTIFVWVVIVTIFLLYYKSKRQKERLMNINTIEEMQQMHRREFEKFIEFVFTEKWFKAKARRWIKDGWIDIDAVLDWRKYLIQCKKRSSYKVTEPNMREFYGSVMSYDKEAKWIYVTTADLTYDAVLFAKNHDIEVWDRNSLVWYVNEYLWKNETDWIFEYKQELIEAILCDRCWAEMVIREAKRGENKGNKFYGCSRYPKCKNIKEIE